MAVSIYDLKLGAQKLEALKVLLERLNETKEVFGAIDLSELRHLHQEILNNEAQVRALKSDFDNKFGIFSQENEDFKAKYKLFELFFDKYGEIKAKIECFFASANETKEQINSVSSEAKQTIKDLVNELSKITQIAKDELEAQKQNALNSIEEKRDSLRGEKGERGETGERGEKGEKGDGFSINAVGQSAELGNFNDEKKGFIFYAKDTQKIYIKLSDASGDFSNGLGISKGEKGEKGDDAHFDFDELMQKIKEDAGLAELFSSLIQKSKAEFQDGLNAYKKEVQEKVDKKLGSELKGVPNGLATLDENAKIPQGQMPSTCVKQSDLEAKANKGTTLGEYGITDGVKSDDERLIKTELNGENDKLLEAIKNRVGALNVVNLTLPVIDFNKGINFTLTKANYAEANPIKLSAVNMDANRAKSGMIFIEHRIAGFDSRFVLINLEYFEIKNKALFNYYISPMDGRVQLFFVANIS